MKIKRSVLKRLILELMSADKDAFADVRKKNPQGFFKVDPDNPKSANYSEEEKLGLMRMMGLQSIQEQEADRQFLKDYQKKLDKKNLLAAIDSGKVTILHSTSYVVQSAGAAPTEDIEQLEKDAYDVGSWLKKYEHSGKNVLSAIMLPYSIDQIKEASISVIKNDIMNRGDEWKEDWINNWIQEEHQPKIDDLEMTELALEEELEKKEEELRGHEDMSFNTPDNYVFISKSDASHPGYEDIQDLSEYVELTRETLNDISAELSNLLRIDAKELAEKQPEFIDLEERFDSMSYNNIKQISGNKSVGVLLKGYPVFMGLQDLESQTISALPDSLKKHQSNSGIAKRPSRESTGVYSLKELEIFGLSDETLIDNWEVVGIWTNVSDSNDGIYKNCLKASQEYDLPLHVIDG